MTHPAEAEQLASVRQAVRGLITAALNNDMPTAAWTAQTLAAEPTLAADAILCLGEIVDVVLRPYAAMTGADVHQVWQGVCARLAERDHDGLEL